jgi:hypothetical protein
MTFMIYNIETVPPPEDTQILLYKYVDGWILQGVAAGVRITGPITDGKYRLQLQERRPEWIPVLNVAAGDVLDILGREIGHQRSEEDRWVYVDGRTNFRATHWSQVPGIK